MFAQTEPQVEPQTEPQALPQTETTKIELQFDPKAISFRLATAELTKRGIPLVPIPPKTKGCQLKDWPSLATTDSAVIAQWKKNGLNQNAGAVAKSDKFCMIDWDDLSILDQLPQSLPKTFTVKSSKGLHHYFKQTDRTRALGNVNVSDPDNPKHRLFDFQQHDKYVVAPYSIHPDGPIYTIQDSSEIVECPDWLVQWMTEQDARQPSPSQKPSQAGSSLAGQSVSPKKGLVIKPPSTTKGQVEQFLDLHGESLLEGEYSESEKRWEWIREARCPWEEDHGNPNSKKDFAIYLNDDGVLGVKCVHGHGGEKHWSDYRAYLEKRTGWTFNMATGEKVFLTDDETPVEEWVNFPSDALLGGWLGEVTEIVTGGTTLSKEMADSYQRAILGVLLDGHVGWHKTAPMHTKFWTMNVAPAGTGKGELWKRLGSENSWSDSAEGGIVGAYSKLLRTNNVDIAEGCGSSEGLLTSLKDKAYRVILRFDEMSSVFEKNSRVGASILSSIRSLFDQTKMENRTIARKTEIIHARLGLSADIQPEIWDKVVMSNDLRSNGFLRRVVVAHASQSPQNDLPELSDKQLEKLDCLIAKITARLEELQAFGYDDPDMLFKPVNYQKAFCPVIEGEAKALYESFRKELQQTPSDMTQGLMEYLKRDILLRTLFSDDYKTVSVEAVKRGVAWVRYQWEVRNLTWRESFEEKASMMEAAITDTFKRRGAKHGKKYGLKSGMAGMTRREIYKYGNLQRKGGLDHFNRTFNNMLGTQLIREAMRVKVKNHGELSVYTMD